MQTPMPDASGPSDGIVAVDPLADERPAVEVHVDDDKQHARWTPTKIALWVAIALVGAVACVLRQGSCRISGFESDHTVGVWLTRE